MITNHLGKFRICKLMKESIIARGIRNKIQEALINQRMRVVYLLKKTSLPIMSNQQYRHIHHCRDKASRVMITCMQIYERFWMARHSQGNFNHFTTLNLEVWLLIWTRSLLKPIGMPKPRFKPKYIYQLKGQPTPYLTTHVHLTTPPPYALFLRECRSKYLHLTTLLLHALYLRDRGPWFIHLTS